MFGIGLILGAGIYVLVGRAASFVGDAVWLSVVFSGAIAVLTALSYAEFASIYPFASSTHRYVAEAFPRWKLLPFLAAWMVFFEGVAGAATAALGFASYFARLAGLGESSVVLTSLLLILILSLLNWWGVKESAALSAIFTFIEAGGLLLVILLGFLSPARSPNYLSFNSSIEPWRAVLIGAAIFYFAYTGFEFQPTLSEETKDPEKVVPKAILLATALTTALYLLVSLSVVRLMSWAELGSSGAPLADAAARAWKPAFHALMAIALFATTNTSLGFLVTASRLLYGLAEERVAWHVFRTVDRRRGTPAVAVAFTGAVSVLILVTTWFLPELTGWRLQIAGFEYKLIDLVGKTSSLAVLLAYLFVNAAMIAIRSKKPSIKGSFTAPFSVGRVPILPIIANALIIIFLFVSFGDWIVWLSTALVTALGLLLYRNTRD